MADRPITTRRAFLSAAGKGAAGIAAVAALSGCALPAIAAEPLDRDAKFKAACKAFKAACIEYDPTILGLTTCWSEESDETAGMFTRLENIGIYRQWPHGAARQTTVLKPIRSRA